MKLKKTITTIQVVAMSAITGMSIPEAEIYGEILQIKMIIASDEMKEAARRVLSFHNSFIQKIINSPRTYVERFG